MWKYKHIQLWQVQINASRHGQAIFEKIYTSRVRFPGRQQSSTHCKLLGKDVVEKDQIQNPGMTWSIS